MGPYPGYFVETRLAAISSDAVLLAVRDRGGLLLVPMEWDARFAKWKGNPDYFRLGLATAPIAGRFALGQLEATTAAGDVMTAVVAGSGLGLAVWRVGVKP